MKTAICGTWHVHAKQYAAQALKYSELIGVWDGDSERRREFAQKYSIPEFGSFEELLNSDAEGVIVCSASSEHADMMVRIAEAKKNIFTEKVLALTSAECARVKAAVEKNGVKFVISLFQKYLAPLRTAKEIADSGKLGRINYVRFRNCHDGSSADWLPAHFYNRGECGGGAMIDLGAHGMYIIDWILGMPESARSVFTVANTNAAAAEKNTDGVEDNAVTVMSYKNGAVAINETGFVTFGCPRILEIGGENGYVRAVGDEVTFRGRETDDCEERVPLLEEQPIPIMQFLTDEILPGCGIDEAMNLTAMMEKAYSAR